MKDLFKPAKQDPSDVDKPGMPSIRTRLAPQRVPSSPRAALAFSALAAFGWFRTMLGGVAKRIRFFGQVALILAPPGAKSL